MQRSRGHVLALTVGALLLTVAPQVRAERSVLGKKVTRRNLAALEGESAPVLESGKTTILLFFRPNHEFSEQALGDAERARRHMGARPVRFLGIVSDRHDAELIKTAMVKAGAKFPVLIDDGDRLYGDLQVQVRPTAAVIDRDDRLVAWQPFKKVNFHESLEARIRHVLKEISDDELKLVLDPPKSESGGPQARARRLRMFAMKLFEAKKYDAAAKTAREGFLADPSSADARTLLGLILAAKGDCLEALHLFQEAIELNPKDEKAREGQAQCRGKTTDHPGAPSPHHN